MGRRELLKGFINLFFGSLVMLAGGLLYFAYPNKKPVRTLTYIPVFDAEELPSKHVKIARFTYRNDDKDIAYKIYISPTTKGHIALSPVCSHLGCLVNWDSISKEFVCPCHAGRYNMFGDVISGPPTRPLSRLPIQIENGKVFVGMDIKTS
ncbi:MAG: ubiquinol-cytochrome c reductase iron-sulfur subunit [Thermodesulfovibrionales bacterium]|nr:ubiquinol-cytochrome c reductase iron-sulfur subunit [Thermodesulfovibrionales bacterium]